MEVTELQPNITRVKQDIETVASFVDQTKPGWTRRPFTTWYDDARAWLIQQMQSLNMDVSIDASSNIIGSIKGKNLELPPIIIGSHLDTVEAGGRFDGIIGVLGGLEITRLLTEQGIKLVHTLEIVDFTAEEPSEFGISTIGSRGMIGNLSKTMLSRQDPNGLLLSEAIRNAGGRPEEIEKTQRKKGDVAFYLEMHIEQGPVLEESKHTLGVVTGIVGIHRYQVTVEGKPNHAGTTPMSIRQDALTAASEITLLLEKLCQQTFEEPVVGTVGKMAVEPNAANVIPGKVTFEFEVRSLDSLQVEQLISSFQLKSKDIAARRQVSITFDCLSKSQPIHVDSSFLQIIEDVCQAIAPSIRIASGAGHDANQLATIAPIGMIFVPSCDGRSHCPEEWTDYEDVATGIQAMAQVLLKLDQFLLEQSKK